MKDTLNRNSSIYCDGTDEREQFLKHLSEELQGLISDLRINERLLGQLTTKEFDTIVFHIAEVQLYIESLNQSGTTQ